MSKCITRITLLIVFTFSVLTCVCSKPHTGYDSPPNEEDESVEYEDVPPTMFGERLYSLIVELINGYVTGIQDILDTKFKPIMYIVEKITDQLDQ